VATIQIDGTKKCFYLISTEATLLDTLLRHTNGPPIYDHGESEVPIVKINPAGITSRNVH